MIGTQVLVSPGIRECNLGMSISMTPVGHRTRRTMRTLMIVGMWCPG
jgi:hypothetical protein